MIDWHRLFGLALCDLFADSPWIVELEKDLSLKQQFLDVVIVRREPGAFAGRLHYVNYRKQVSGEELLAETSFQLFGVTVRYPRGLAKEINLEPMSPGVTWPIAAPTASWSLC